MDPHLYEYLDATIVQQSSPDEAFRRFDDIANRHTDILRKITKQVQECRQNNDNEAVKKAVNEYDEALEKYIPVLMSQAKIYWDQGDYSMVEKIFRKSVEFCNEHDTWKLNVAHVLFMQVCTVCFSCRCVLCALHAGMYCVLYMQVCTVCFTCRYVLCALLIYLRTPHQHSIRRF